jgi:aryl-alcohol dehydrogenase-like predicted oxidoreductase
VEQRYVGRSGLKVSSLGLGTLTWGQETDEHDARDQLKAFVSSGGTLVDTGDAYGDGRSESVLGDLLGDVVLREEVVLCVTAGPSPAPPPPDLRPRPDSSARALLASLERSLRRLGTDHLDLWWVPAWDPDVPVAEVLRALDTAVSSGRVRYAGVAEHTGWQLATTACEAATAGVPLVATTVEYSMLHRCPELEVLPAAAHHRLGVVARSPLAHGVLTAKYRTSVPPVSRGTDPVRAAHVDRYLSGPGRRVVEAVLTAADGLDAEPWEVALAWVRDAPGVTCTLVGARNGDQLDAALAAEDLVLPPEIRAALNDVAQ